MARYAPTNIEELRDAVAMALSAQEAVEIIGRGSKRNLGRPLQTPHMLDLAGLLGIREYEPSELTLTAAAATPLAEIERALAEAGQMLAFEPPDWRGLLGDAGAEPTLGGVLACNLSGPRRFKAGAGRDHLLGFRGVSGRAEIFKAGGKVVKNVTGYDLSKLIAGSYGTLVALEEVTVKVLPRPETVATVVLHGLDAAEATRVMAAALGSPHDVSGAAFLHSGFISPALPAGTVVLRVEGPAPSVEHRSTALISELAAHRADLLDHSASLTLWRDISEVAPLLSSFAVGAVWRVSVAPSRGAAVAEAVGRQLDAAWFLDWGGGLVWLAVPEIGDGGAAIIRAALRGPDGRGTGHATLVKGSPALRRAVPVFEPQPPALAALSRRVKDAFDPHHILNPGRLTEQT